MCVRRCDSRLTLQVHNEAWDGWKTDGFPSYSTHHQRYISRVLTASAHCTRFMIGRGYPADRIATVPLGINISRFEVTDAETRREAKRRLLGLDDPDRTFVIVDTARVDGQKRPHLVPKTIRLLVDALARVPPAQRDFDRVLTIMIGDGPLRTATEELVESLNVTQEVVLLGTIMEPAGYLQAGDVYFLPVRLNPRMANADLDRHSTRR